MGGGSGTGLPDGKCYGVGIDLRELERRRLEALGDDVDSGHVHTVEDEDAYVEAVAAGEWGPAWCDSCHQAVGHACDCPVRTGGEE